VDCDADKVSGIVSSCEKQPPIPVKGHDEMVTPRAKDRHLKTRDEKLRSWLMRCYIMGKKS
jgi:hypothetical protein